MVLGLGSGVVRSKQEALAGKKAEARRLQGRKGPTLMDDALWKMKDKAARLKRIKELVKKDADVNEEKEIWNGYSNHPNADSGDEDGGWDSPLLRAVMTNEKLLHEETIQFLLSKGANAEKPFHPEMGSVLMAYLMKYREHKKKPSLQSVKSLLDAGAEPDAWVDAGYAGMVEAHMIADGTIKDFPDHSNYVERDPVWRKVMSMLANKSRMRSMSKKSGIAARGKGSAKKSTKLVMKGKLAKKHAVRKPSAASKAHAKVKKAGVKKRSAASKAHAKVKKAGVKKRPSGC